MKNKNGDDFVYEWGFESFQLSQLEEIDFDLNVPGASPGSVVPVISEVFLSYYNSKGEHIERVLGGESLNVLQYSFSGLVDVDRFSYTYNQKVKIGSNIRVCCGGCATAVRFVCASWVTIEPRRFRMEYRECLFW